MPNMHAQLAVLGALAARALALPQLLPIPLSTTRVAADGAPPFELGTAPRTVAITRDLASWRDEGGLTLIPPSGREFAEVFLADLRDLTKEEEWSLRTVDTLEGGCAGICLGRVEPGRAGPPTHAYEDGQATEEGYDLEIGAEGVVVRGSGARGMFWGTRTLLQQLMAAAAGSGTLGAARVRDAPAYATRGYLLDAGRKWYEPSFLKELCTYASFFKMSEFHYHTSDNYPLSRGRNETWREVYAQFSLRPEAEGLRGLVQRANETLDRAAFEDLQRHCALRGVTVVPEIEAPGHCLAITKWRPELALGGDEARDLLNLTHPDSIPTVKRIWDEFLPWFATREVHIGADEYDPALADDYIGFVNELAAHVRDAAGKRVRIWGTHEPSARNLTIDREVAVQHWQYGQSDPLRLLLREGRDVINSEDWWAYVSLKNDHAPISPAPYPQFFNESRLAAFGGRRGLWWNPALVNPFNASQQLPAGARGSRGAVLAAWNDNGPDATTQLEAFYAVRRGVPLVAARAWAGARGPEPEGDAAVWGASLDFFAARAPGQNLDRVLHACPFRERGDGDTILRWSRPSGDGSAATVAGGTEKAAPGVDEGTVMLGCGSKGMDYTLELAVDGPFVLSSEDSTLALDDGGSLVFSTADGWAYPLRAVAEAEAESEEPEGEGAANPGRIWANSTASSHEPVSVATTRLVVVGDAARGSRVWADGLFAGRFEVLVYGGRNQALSWSPMALVGPVLTVRGGVRELVLREGVHVPRG